jgi:hypothetical protein
VTTHYRSFEAEPLNDWMRHTLVRSVAKLRGIDPHSAARRVFPNSAATALKAATTPASTSGWGQQLSATVVAEFLRELRPRSAAATLLERTFRVDLTGGWAVSLPRPASDWAPPAWVSEAGAIPVDTGVFALDQLGPLHKLAAIAVLSSELSEATGEAAEQIIRDQMLEASGRALDSALFSATAASSTRPAGLLNGISAITAASGGGITAMVTDLQAMVAAIVAGGGGASVAVFAHPVQALAINALAANGLGYPVIPAPSLALGTVVAVDLGGFAWAGELPPEIDIGRHATLHMETSPSPISTVGTPNVVAAPVRSTFQTNTFALRLLLPISWVKRSATSVQYMTGVSW